MKKAVKKIFIVCISIALIFNTIGMASASALVGVEIIHATGLIPDSPEVVQEHLHMSPVMSSALPSAVDNTAKFPTPGDQQTQKSCAAWSVGYSLKSGQEINKRGWSRNSTAHQFSPAYIYNQLNVNGGGLAISQVMDLICSQGVCSLNYFPYNTNDYTTQPTNIQRAAASLYKATTWHTIQGVNQIKNRIAQGDGVVIGIWVNNDFFYLDSSNPIYDNKNAAGDGKHGICLIGYDDSKKAFKFINSWGTGWQLGGYGWISYDLVNDSDVNLNGAGIGYVLEYSQYDDYMLGDVTGDSNVTAADARLVLRFSSKLETPTAMQAALADVNGDAKITAADSRSILSYSAHEIDKLPLYE